ncbi:hypothetical protein TTRE_0000129301 [Trichuris trichiura]|uniref:Uncharacterized protein n=1 Tax=Trichuris trichiura TaxID=36087 RepID=A0A077Z2U4_TRITR|nr:hypothetical protein TTRE_0000129301 [Trichuris trichiura]
MGACASAKTQGTLERSISSRPNQERLIDVYRKLIKPCYSWVLFANGTAVVLNEDKCDLSIEMATDYARKKLKKCAKAKPGTPMNDITAQHIPWLDGWLVNYKSRRVTTFIPVDGISLKNGEDKNDPMTFGLLGRILRAKDAEELDIIHLQLGQ